MPRFHLRRETLGLGLLTAATGYAVATHGAIETFDWNVALAIIGFAGVICARSNTRLEHSELFSRLTVGAALLFPAYVAFQLLPLPMVLIRVLDPTRAEIADALKGVVQAGNFAPVSIVPGTTWVYLSKIAGYALIFLGIRHLARRFEGRPWLVAMPLIAIGAVEAALGFARSSGAAQAMSGTYYNKNHFAGLMEMVLPLALMYGVALLHRGRERGVLATSSAIKALGFFILAAGMCVAVVFSLSKMGFISMVGSLLVMAILSLEPSLSVRKRWIAGAALAVLAVLAVVFLPTSELIGHFGEAASDPTAEGRWPIARDTLRLISAYPLFGSGLGTFYPALLRYQTFGLNLAWINPHNDYLQLFSELGLVGFLIPATLMAVVFAHAVRTARSGETRELRFLGVAFAGSLAAMLIHSVGDFNLYVPANAIALSWIAGMTAALPSAGDDMHPATVKKTTPLHLHRLVFGVGCLATLYASLSLVFLHSFKSDRRAERIFCRVGICDSYEALSALQVSYGGVAGVPPADLVELLQRDPAGPYRWCDLGESLQKAGHITEARYCFSRALTLGPRIPYMQVRAAGFHFDQGEANEALGLMSRALEGNPGFDQMVFTDYEQRRTNLHDVLRHGLPGSPVVWRSYLRWLIARESPDAAIVWASTVQHGYVDDPLASEYVEGLIARQKPDAASDAWALYAGGRSEGYPGSNRVFNGDFERDSTGSRFDWQLGNRPGVTVSIDSTVAYAGQRSARIRFDGTQNVTSIDLQQTIFMPPGRYTFQAYVKTDGLTTDQGVLFAISGDSVNVTTDSFTGTSDWCLVEKSFQVPPAARLVGVRVLRNPSLKFDNQIKGALWIDHVKIVAEQVQSTKLTLAKTHSYHPA